jgi:hypothetical protein
MIVVRLPRDIYRQRSVPAFEERFPIVTSVVDIFFDRRQLITLRLRSHRREGYMALETKGNRPRADMICELITSSAHVYDHWQATCTLVLV